MFQSFSKFHRNSIAQACLFLAAKVEEQPRKLEHVIKVSHMILHRDQGQIDTKSVAYLEQAQELVVNENILLQTLGFEFQVDHPHAHIVKTCNLIRAPKDLTQTSYFLATNSLHLTQMSLSYKPTFVACVCIHLACKWAQFEIPRSNEGKEWWFYVDKEMTAAILEELTTNFLSILDKCPSKFKKKLMSKSAKDEDLLSMLQERKPMKSEPTSTVTSDTSTSLTAAASRDFKPKVKVEIGDDSPPPSKVPKILSPPNTTKPPQPSGAKGHMIKVKSESYINSLTTKEYFERKEREQKEKEHKERERIERLKMHSGKESASKDGSSHRSSQQHRESERKAAALAHAAKSHASQPREHTNIFDQLIGERQKSDSTDNTDSVVPPVREKHSQAQQNYKEKFHSRERSDKQPFSPEAQKEQRKSGSHRPHGEQQRPEVTASGRHGVDLKHKGRSAHEHKHPEHRPHLPPAKDPQKQEVARPAAANLPEVRVRLPILREVAKSVTLPPSEDITSVDKPKKVERLKEEIEESDDQVEVEEKPVRVEEVKKVEKVEVDPEEGEILDDDSPVESEVPREEKRSHQREADRAHHRHHPRERRSSGRHHHTAPAVAPPVVHAEPTPHENRTRHRSPRTGHPPKEEPHHHHPPRERKSSGPRHEAPTPEVPPKIPNLENIQSKIFDDVALSKQATPEPGEIVEHSSHRHHHKSSHSKHKKEKHRDRDRERERDASSLEGGSLKIKLDLKAISNASTPTKHSSPVVSMSGDERKKEIKLKIKTPVMPAKDNKEGRDTPTSLKMKLKIPSSSTPTGTGNGETSTPEAKVSSKRSENKVSVPNALKLTLSKDSSSGQFVTHETGSSHRHDKSHRHSSAAEKSSRKRPFSPSEAALQRHKLPRNESGSNLTSRRSTNDLQNSLTAASSGTSSPLTSGGASMASPALMDVTRQLQRLIEQKNEALEQQRRNPSVFPPSDTQQSSLPHS